jgi:transcriptional regulator with XRE-family HTH domain
MKLNLRNVRRSKNVTQEELAEKSGVSRATISYLETGVAVDTTVGTLTKLAQALEIGVGELFMP